MLCRLGPGLRLIYGISLIYENKPELRCMRKLLLRAAATFYISGMELGCRTGCDAAHIGVVSSALAFIRIVMHRLLEQ